MRTLKRPTGNEPARLVAILGLGSDEWGDDAAGLWVARQLQRRANQSTDFRVIEAGSMPENFSGVLRRLSPGFILLVDAMHGGSEPGKIRWIEFDQLGGVSAFTHGLPLSLQAEYLKNELGCEVGLIGIEGANFHFGEPLSPAVRRSAQRVVQAIRGLFE